MAYRFIIALFLLAGCGTTSTEPPHTPIPPTSTLTAAEMTFVIGATQTGVVIATNPAAAPTLVQSQLFRACTPGSVSNVFDGQTSARLQTALDSAEVKDTFISVITTEDSSDCNNIVTTHTLYSLTSTVGNVNDNAIIGGVVAQIMAVLADQPAPNTITFQFESSNNGDERAFLDLTYADVLAAYTAGLREEALIERLN